ncbi:hypothetical protein GCK32_016815, partial [Trichostrongylus colubriformis]
LLTKAVNRLSTILKEEADIFEAEWETSLDRDSMQTLRRRIRQARTVIMTEVDKVSRQVERRFEDNQRKESEQKYRKESSEARTTQKFRGEPCFYCEKWGHKPRNCMEVPTVERRIQTMRTKKLCNNCGGKDHRTEACSRGACRVCKEVGHHTSICKKLVSLSDSARTPAPARTSKKTPTTSPKTQAKVNTVTCEQPQQQVTEAVFHVSNAENVHILVGQAQVLNPTTQALEPVHVMLDTGADRSFITDGLATRLKLKDEDASRLSISTFASKKPMDNATIPKLELNALTMAVRLARSILDAISSRTRIQEVIILSDSEIALSWVAMIPTQRLSSRELYLQPTIPLKIEGMDLTMTSVTMPPTPELSSAFISDGFNLAVWKHSIMPSLVCDSEEAARELNCSTNSDCVCEPAESKINCLCNDVNITDVFENELENRLPARRPWVLFEQSKEDRSSVTATIPSFVSVELIIHLKDKFTKTTTTVTDATCKVTDAIVQGCYQCPQGAFAEVTCRTNGKDTMATVRCKDDFFTIPCNVTGHTSTIIFRATTARISRICEVECGSTSTTFELTGTLKWVRTIHESVSRIINGRSNVYDEIVLPDIFHIADIFLTWYKTVIGVALAFVAALFVSYIMFWTCGLTVFFRILKRLRQLVIKLATITFAIVQKLLAGAKALAREKKPPKKPSMDAPTGTTNAPKTAPTPTTTSKRPVPPKQPKSTTNPAQSTAGKPPAPETGASRKRPSTSEHENTEAPVSKRGRASGTLLKDLLQQASKILQLAASKADDFAPAVIPHVEGLERMEQIEGKLDDILGKLGKNATSDEIMENHCALGVRLDEILSNVREINEKLEFPDIRKIAFEMNLMNVRMTEMEKHLIPASTHATNAPAELTPSRSEARRGSDNSILRESKPGDPRHSDNSRRTSPRDDDRRTQHSKNSRRTPQPRDSRRTPPPRDSRRTPPQRATRRTPPPRGSRRTPPPRDSRRTPPPRDSRRT